MWVRKYDQKGDLSVSVKFNEKGETKSLYSIEGKGYLRFNDWSDDGGDKVTDYKVYDEEVKLTEDKVGGTTIFRCLNKESVPGKMIYPNHQSHFSIENGDITNFNVDKNKLQQWKTKAQVKKSHQKMNLI